MGVGVLLHPPRPPRRVRRRGLRFHMLRNIVETWHARLRGAPFFDVRRVHEREPETMREFADLFPRPERESLKRGLQKLIDLHEAQRARVEESSGQRRRTGGSGFAAGSRRCRLDAMRISVAADERTGVAEAVARSCAAGGTSRCCTARSSRSDRDDWAWASEAAARDVAEGRADQAIVACWTGTGARSRPTRFRGSERRLRSTPRPRTARASGTTRTCSRCRCARRAGGASSEILDAWFSGAPSEDPVDLDNVRHLEEIA